MNIISKSKLIHSNRRSGRSSRSSSDANDSYWNKLKPSSRWCYYCYITTYILQFEMKMIPAASQSITELCILTPRFFRLLSFIYEIREFHKLAL